ncbi:MAG: T9SS type A sorting domain-containing protein [Saprospiraceae bacterium]|nr:T9SS type A sorting domain-containing protein [Saprospiraceae bacterium]
MQQRTNLICFFLLLVHQAIIGQGFVQIGNPLVDEVGTRMITMGDGSFITVGVSGGKLAMYKTDCLGNKVATLEKQVSPGPALLWDVLELPDGNLVAVGSANLATATDTANHVYLIKTSSGLMELSASSFLIQNKAAQGKSLALGNSGTLMIWGEVEGAGLDFSDVFLQKVDAATLQPVAAPVIFSNGVDQAGRIIAGEGGRFLLAGNTFTGDFFNPNTFIVNVLRVMNVDDNGVVQWQVEIPQTFQAKYGLATTAGLRKSLASGNYMLGGTLYGGTDQRAQDAFFALISPNGVVLDTAYAAAAGPQQYHAMLSHQDNPGLFTIVGQGVELQPDAPTLALAQAFELNNEIFIAAASVDVATPVALHDILELDPGRFAYMGNLPDNPFSFSFTDIIIATPEVNVGIVYQNCALAATLNTTGSAYQWYYEGQPIPNANLGVYFPTQPGVYSIQVLDSKGCAGISEEFILERATALFDHTAANLTVEFENLSTAATQYQWNFGDGGTSISINPVHTYAAEGVYQVTLIAKTACGPAFADTITQQVVVISSAADEVAGEQQVSIYPNPTSGLLTVHSNFEASEPAELILTSAMGQTMRRAWVSGTCQTDLQDLPPGVYSLSIRTGKALKTFQVVKQ